MMRPMVVKDKDTIRDLTAEVARLRLAVYKYDAVVARLIQDEKYVPEAILAVFYDRLRTGTV